MRILPNSYGKTISIWIFMTEKHTPNFNYGSYRLFVFEVIIGEIISHCFCVEGLVNDRKMVVIASRGGEYISQEMRKIDFQEPYLRAIFGFVGIADMTFIVAQPMDMGLEIQGEKIEEARKLSKKIAEAF